MLLRKTRRETMRTKITTALAPRRHILQASLTVGDQMPGSAETGGSKLHVVLEQQGTDAAEEGG